MGLDVILWFAVVVLLVGLVALWEFFYGFKHPQVEILTTEEFEWMQVDPEDERLFFNAEVQLEKELNERMR